MRLVPYFGWQLEGERTEPLDERLLPLVEAIATTTSLARAVAERGISYRAAWGLLRDYERKLGAPLVRLERGRGARLAPAGETLLRAQKSAAQRLARVLPGLATDVGPLAHERTRGQPSRLRIAASHDLALATLSEALPTMAGIELDLAVMGSLHALREFAEGRADAAGFHVPLGHGGIERAPFLRWLDPRRDRLVRFVDREQGMILPHGNPARVKHFRDLVRRKLRFVNRQRGSGTRLLIDTMLADEGVNAAALIGSGTEEFTHAAVAATVASGGADAGFGLRAAAAEYALAFVPLIQERYFLAVHADAVEKAPFTRFVAALRSPSFTRIAQRLPGYRSDAAGTMEELDALGPRNPAKSRPTTRKRP